MKNIKNTLMAVGLLALAFGGNSAQAQYSGVFGYGIELQGNGAGALHNGSSTLYELFDVDPRGGSGDRLVPTGSTATLDGWTSDNNANNPDFNLGTFLQGSDSLILKGGSVLSYSGNGDTVTLGALDYVIGTISGGTVTYPSGFQFDQLPLDQNNVAGANGDQRWATEGQSVNLLAGLAPGTYALQTFGFVQSTTDVGNNFANNNGGNYGAQFTVVAAPEPSTWALTLGGFAALFFVVRRKSSLV